MSDMSQLGIRIFLDDTASAGLGVFGNNLMGIDRLIGAAGMSFGRMNPLLQAAGVMAAGSGLAFGAFAGTMAWAVKQAANLQDAMELVKTQVSGARDHIDALQQMLVTLADASQYSATQVAEGFATLGAGGADASDLLNTTIAQSMINLAVDMNETDGVTQSAKLLIDTLDQFGAPASDAAHYANVLDVAFKNGIPDISSLTQAFSDASPSAHALGISVDELAAYLDALTRMMGSGSKAGISLNMMLQGLINPTAKASKEMGDLGLITVNSTNPALENLIATLSKASKAGATAAANFQPTIAGLQAIFTAANKANIPGLGSNFMQWASQVGAVSNKFYDARGNFLGLANALQVIHTSVQGMDTYTMQTAISNMFNKTALRGILDLVDNLDKVNPQVANLEQQMQGTAQATQDATDKNSSYNARLREITTTIQNIGAAIGGPLRDSASQWLNTLNGIIGPLATMNSGMAGSIAQFLEIGAAIAGVTFVLSALVLVFSAFSGIIPMVALVAAGIVGLTLAIQQQVPMVTAAFGIMSRNAQIQTMQMKLNTTADTLAMATQNIANIRVQQQQTEQLIKQTHDAHTREMLKMKLDALDASSKQAQGVVANMQKQRQGIEAQLQQLDPVAKMHSLQMKNDALQESEAQARGVIANNRQEAEQIIAQIKDTSNKHTKTMLEMKLKALDASDAQQRGVVANIEKQRTGVEASINKLKTQMDAEANNIFVNFGQKLQTQVINELQKLYPVFALVAGSLAGLGAALLVINFGAIMAGLGAMATGFITMATMIVPSLGIAFLAAGVDFVVAFWPAIVVGLAVAALVAGLILAFGGWGNFLKGMGAFFGPVIDAVKSAGAAIMSSLHPSFAIVANLWNQQLKPAFMQLWQTLQQLAPLFEIVGAVIGGVLVIAFGILVAVLGGLVHAFAQVLVGIATILGGLVMIVTGAIHIIIAIIMFLPALLYGIFTGNFGPLKAAWASLWTGIGLIAKGIVTTIVGVFISMFGPIIGFFTGFVAGIIAFFQHLFDVLVGHSIVPDLINSILKWIGSLPEKAFVFILNLVTGIINFFLTLEMKVLGAVTSLVMNILTTLLHLEMVAIQYVLLMVSMLFNLFNTLSGGVLGRVMGMVNGLIDHFSSLPGKIVGALAGLGNLLYNSGRNAMQMFANGIGSMINAVLGPIENVAGKIAGFLAHHSPAAMGPLSDDDKWMGNMMKMHTQEILRNAPMLQAAAHHAAMAVHDGFSSPNTNAMHHTYAAHPGGIGGKGGNTTLNFNIEGKQVAQCVIDNISGQLNLNNVRSSFR